MAWVIAVLGAALAAGGGVALWNGSGYIRLDWGQAQTVAGTVALSAGVVTLAIAAVLFKLAEALRDVARRPALAPVAPGGAARVGLEAVHLADEGEGEFVQAPPPASARSRLAGRLARVGVPRPERAEPVAAEPAEREPEPVPAPVDAEPAYAPAPRAAHTAASTAAPAPAPIAIAEAPRPAAVAAEAPTVVGRYEANGASYVLFSDGTIEVETEGGTHRFASMAALKDHIERQDAV